jgi:chromosome segregation ATPase
MELGDVEKYKAEISEHIRTIDSLVKDADSLQREIDTLEDDLKYYKEQNKEQDNKIDSLETDIFILEGENYTTLHGQQKGEIIERLKRLDLKTLEAIDLCYSAHLLGFETILD